MTAIPILDRNAYISKEEGRGGREGTPVARIRALSTSRRAIFLSPPPSRPEIVPPLATRRPIFVRRATDSRTRGLDGRKRIRLIYSQILLWAPPCWPRTGPRKPARSIYTARLQKAIPPARRDRSINFTSLSNPIFSRYPRVLHDTFY